MMILGLAACGNGSGGQITIKTTNEEIPQIDLPDPDILNLRNIRWYVLTYDNFDEKIEEIIAAGNKPVFFALTETGYKNLVLNIADLRQFIQQQQTILAASVE